jgi:C4-dicarboxylate transporter, DctM subunit
MGHEWVGFSGIAVLIIMLFAGIPIGLSMLFLGVLGLLFVSGLPPMLWAVSSVLFHESFHWTFIVLPMFFLLGDFAFNGDIGRDTYIAINAWIGRVRGALLIGTICACAAMGFASGSSLATAATFTRLSLPEMKKHGYNLSFSAGGIACAGTLAALIPPSGMMVIFTVLTGVSLGELMLAGVVPGLMTGLFFVVALVIQLKMRPAWAPVQMAKVSFREKIISIRLIAPLLGVIVAILGGMYMGVFTPTEAGAAGAMVTFLFFVARKGLQFKAIFESLLGSVLLSSKIFIIIIGAMLFSRFLAVSGVMEATSGFLLGLTNSSVVLLVLILVLYLVLGTFMEAVAIMALTLPMFYPILTKVGFDGVFIGIVVLMMVEIGVITPPLGTNVFAVKSAAGDLITIDEVFRGIIPFFFAYLFAVATVVAIPEIALFLPKLMR